MANMTIEEVLNNKYLTDSSLAQQLVEGTLTLDDQIIKDHIHQIGAYAEIYGSNEVATVNEPEADPTDEPAVDLVEEPVVEEPTKEPETDLTDEPAADPVEEPEVEVPTEEPEADPTDEPEADPTE